MMRSDHLNNNRLEASHSRPTFLIMNQTLRKLKIDINDFYQKSRSSQKHNQKIFSSNILATIAYPKGLIINQMNCFSKRKQIGQQNKESEETDKNKVRTHSLFTRQQKNLINFNSTKGLVRIKNRKAVSQLAMHNQQVSQSKQFQSDFSMNNSVIKKVETTIDQLRKSQEKHGIKVSGAIIPEMRNSIEQQQKNPHEKNKIRRANTFVKTKNGNSDKNYRINDILLQPDVQNINRKQKMLNMFKMEVIEYEQPSKYATISHENSRNNGFARFKQKNKTSKTWKKHIDNDVQFPYPFNEENSKQNVCLSNNRHNIDNKHKQFQIIRQKYPIRVKKICQKHLNAHIAQKIQPSIQMLKLNQKHKTMKMERSFTEKLRQNNEKKAIRQTKKIEKKIQDDLFLIQNICGWQSRQIAANFGDQIPIE